MVLRVKWCALLNSWPSDINAARTPWKPKNESRSVLFLIWALQNTLWSILWHLSIIELDSGFRLVTIFRCMPHSFLRVSLASAANSVPLSIAISVGHGCRESQWNSNQLAVVMACFLPISTASKCPVAGSTIVRQSSSMHVSVFFLIPNSYGPTRSTHNVCHGTISGVGLGGCKPHFLSRFLLMAQLGHCLHARSHVPCNPIHVQCCATVNSSRCSPGCINVKLHHLAHLCYRAFGM